MQIVKTFLWAGTIFLIVIMGFYSQRFRKAEVKGIVALEFADTTEGTAIIQSWNDKGLISTAKRVTYIDFIFLAFYSLLMMRCSSDQMNLEKNVALNNLLRFNLLLAVLTGLLDIAENFILLHNINESAPYIQSFYLTLPKFIFAGWIILVWVVAIVGSRIRRIKG